MVTKYPAANKAQALRLAATWRAAGRKVTVKCAWCAHPHNLRDMGGYRRYWVEVL